MVDEMTPARHLLLPNTFAIVACVSLGGSESDNTQTCGNRSGISTSVAFIEQNTHPINEANVAKDSVLAAATILLKHKPNTSDEFKAKFAEHKGNNGLVWYGTITNLLPANIPHKRCP